MLQPGLSDVHVHVNHGLELFKSAMSFDVMTHCHLPSWRRVNNNNNNNNNNNHDNVYGAVIMAEPLQEFTRFI